MLGLQVFYSTRTDYCNRISNLYSNGI